MTDFPTACPDCQQKPEPRFGEQKCRGCGRMLIVCSDGACWPLTGMGGQAAGWHEHELRNPPQPPTLKQRLRQRLRLEISLPSKHTLALAPGKLMLISNDVYANGDQSTWYPVWISVTKPRRGFKLNKPRRPKGSGEPVARITSRQLRKQLEAKRAAKEANQVSQAND